MFSQEGTVDVCFSCGGPATQSFKGNKKFLLLVSMPAAFTGTFRLSVQSVSPLSPSNARMRLHVRLRFNTGSCYSKQENPVRMPFAPKLPIIYFQNKG